MNDKIFIANILRGNNNPPHGKVEFNSSDHVRFQNGRNVSGHNYGRARKVVIEKNIENKEGYTVSIYNMDGIHPQYQMTPKPMKIVRVENNSVEFQGYGYDERAVAMGVPVNMASFKDYGVVVMIENGDIVRVQLNMYDRNISLIYLQ